jgi:formylglycine-generating enzyme
VSYTEAVEFCRKRSARSEEKKAGRRYRLPTEAEWEYSCRGGASSYQPFHFGRSLTPAQANFINSDLERPTTVGFYTANGFGLHDVHGNVEEWCADWYAADYYERSPRPGPWGAPQGPGPPLHSATQ